MIALIDNDVILKLAKWDLLNELVEIFGGEIGDIYHLPTCKYVLCPQDNPSKAMKRCGDQATIDRIIDFCSSTKPISQPVDAKWLELLNKIQGIDVGEVLIFAIGAEIDDSLLYIGDKRSIIALMQAVEVSEIVALLERKIKCLEQVLAEMICIYGVTCVRNKVKSCLPADTAMRLIFSPSGTPSMEMDIWCGLNSYYNDLKKFTGNLLAHFPDIPGPILSALQTDTEVLHIS